ncbi:MAG: hypothetical protein LBQ81_04850, partial [Zoogloeaceae bacterium]|nr:hypothetical protein [Zoogloeaceae bacterium]
MTDDNELHFADEDDLIPPGTATPEKQARPWRVMIVDDEPEIHAITRLALSGFSFEGRPLEFISAQSGAEAKTRIAEYPDTAIVLLDVVMETEDAGLEV